jgi:hypothetical protein
VVFNVFGGREKERIIIIIIIIRRRNGTNTICLGDIIT